MPTEPQPTPVTTGTTRRSFLNAGAAAVALGAAASATRATASAAGRDDASPAPGAPAEPEWRNRQPGMAYRRLGRTNLMVSEVVSGGDPITLENYKHLSLAIEMGLNYLDMAPAYNHGDTERAYGKLLAATPGLRDKLFLATKVSDFNKVREGMYDKVLKALPSSKQESIRKQAAELRATRGVEAPGYFLEYFPGQPHAFDASYLRIAMLPEYGPKVEGGPALRKVMVESLEGSLKRVGTDHFDLLMCPHGANAPEDLTPELAEVFADLKRQGKVRFLGVTSHNDPAGVLGAAADAGHYDAAMVAYNVINGGYMAEAVRKAASKGLGVIAMKAAHAVATHHKSLQPVPDWRIAKVNRVVPGDLKPPQKAYLWALQNPQITAVISNLWDETHVRENLSLVGRKVELHSA